MLINGIVIYSDRWLNFWGKGILGMALFPFIIVREDVAEGKDFNRRLFIFKGETGKRVLLNHERIHLTQQAETLLAGFVLVYVLNWIVNLIRFRDFNKAYRNICFEREAKEHAADMDYLYTRKYYSWLKYLKG